MNARNAWEVWAPEDSVWSPWVKPVLFAVRDDIPEGAFRVWGQALEEASERWKRRALRDVALVLDLPGAEALALALVCARLGWRPVPLHNSCPGASALVDNESVRAGLVEGAKLLPQAPLGSNSPPAFVLDALRLTGSASPGKFDNRWAVFPQDLPSAARLGGHGIRQVVLVQAGREEPREDLVHVLRRWQRAGIALESVDVRSQASHPLQVKEPSRFRALGYALLVALRLRRNAAGGFGARVPLPPTGGGGGHHFGGFG